MRRHPARRPANGEIFRARATGCPLARARQPWSRYGLVPAVVRVTSRAMALARPTLLPHVSITYRKIDSDFVRHVVGIDGDGEAQEFAHFRVILRAVRDELFQETMIEVVGLGHGLILSSEWSVSSADAVN